MLHSCSRASFLSRAAVVGGAIAVESLLPHSILAAPGKGAGVAPNDALARLMRGSRTYATTMAGSRVNSIVERVELGNGQAPWASILTCADSRTSPEILFNQGLGDIFVVRTAGNVVETIETASLQYAAAALGSQLIVVLGHSGCGAVQATIDAADGKPAATPELIHLTTAIMPAVERVKGRAGNRLLNATRANVSLTAQRLASNDLLKGLIEKKMLKIVPAYVDLTRGVTTLL